MSWWHYLLLVNFYLVLFFGFYALLLRRETFFQLNRIYLVTAALLSFFIPLMQAEWVKSLFITQKIQSTIYSSPVMGYTITIIPQQDVLTIGEVLNALYIGVTLFLVLRLFWQLLILKKQIEKPEPSAAYSFFKKISLGKDAIKHDVIAAHEQVHAKQWHSVDVMIIETVMIINWFNPVVYLYRFAIKYIHEYIADRQVIQTGTDKAEYAMLLLSQTFNVETHHLATPFFNHTLLKQRIMMLQKNKSQRIALAKYGLSAPLFMLMLILSSATVNNSKAVASINNKAENVFSKPATEAVTVIAGKTGLEKPLTAVANIVTPTILEDFKAEVADVVDTLPILSRVDQQPTFPGGVQELFRYIGGSVRYPKADHDAKVQGKVFVSFVVEPDGALSNIKSLRAPSQTLADEAVRVMKASPKWQPGYQNGNAARVQFILPIAFTLTPDQENKPTTEPQVTGYNTIYSPVDIQPSFPGGMQKFYSFLSQNIRYPAGMKEKNVEGRVYLTFMVETDGTLTDMKVLREPGNYGAGEEAVRVMKLSPRWMPGSKDGIKVKTAYTIPVQFSLSKPEGLGNKDTKNLDAVGIVGYGSTNKPATNITTSSLTINGATSPLYILDGKVVETTANGTPLSTIPQESIASMEILKDANATSIYGDKGKNGVIIITTKRGSRNLATATPGTAPLYIVDGVTKTKADFDALNQKDILSVEVFKDDTATKLYGDKGKNGVIRITTKNAKK